MAIDIKVFDNLRSLKFNLDVNRFGDRLVLGAAKRSINRAVRDGKPFAIRHIRKHRKLKRKDFNHDDPRKRPVTAHKATGKIIADLEGSVNIKQRQFNLIRFLKGSRTPPRPKQKGVKVNRRRPLKFEIRPGRVSKPKGMFLAFGKNPVTGKTTGPVIFRRLPMKRGVKRAQTTMAPQVDSVGILGVFNKSKGPELLKRFMLKKFNDEYERDLKLKVERFLQPRPPKQRR